MQKKKVCETGKIAIEVKIICSQNDSKIVEILSRTNGLSWEDEGTTVTFATYFYRLPKAEKTELEVVFS